MQTAADFLVNKRKAWKEREFRLLKKEWLSQFGDKCMDCGIAMTLKNSNKRIATSCNASVDHITPKVCGGNNLSSNLRVICRGCNQKKGRSMTRVLKYKYTSRKIEALCTISNRIFNR